MNREQQNIALKLLDDASSFMSLFDDEETEQRMNAIDEFLYKATYQCLDNVPNVPNDYNEEWDKDDIEECNNKLSDMTIDQFNEVCALMSNDEELWCVGDAIAYVLGESEKIVQVNGGISND